MYKCNYDLLVKQSYSYKVRTQLFKKLFQPIKKKKIDFTQVKLIIALVIAYIIVKGAGEESVMPGYVATIINIIVIFASIASKVKVHNLACSRPVPHFFDKRKEAGK